MELSFAVLQGLQVAGSSLVNDGSFKMLAKLAAQSALNQTDPADITAVGKLDQGVAKEAYSALATLLVEAARNDTDTAGLSSVLEDCKFAPDRCDVLQGIYSSSKTQLRAALARTSSCLPHVVDVDWRLDYHIKSKHLERVDKPVYLISLKTEASGSSEPQTVQFACTQEQLQDMVSKLRDASKSLEKFSQQ